MSMPMQNPSSIMGQPVQPTAPQVIQQQQPNNPFLKMGASQAAPIMNPSPAPGFGMV